MKTVARTVARKLANSSWTIIFKYSCVLCGHTRGSCVGHTAVLILQVCRMKSWSALDTRNFVKRETWLMKYYVVKSIKQSISINQAINLGQNIIFTIICCFCSFITITKQSDVQIPMWSKYFTYELLSLYKVSKGKVFDRGVTTLSYNQHLTKLCFQTKHKSC